MERVAIVGAGIAGLGCAHFLRRRCAVTLYERNDYAGGHSHMVEVAEEGRRLPIDTGFMVFNRTTYPLLTRLFERLQVEVRPAAMSFSVRHAERNLEFGGSSLNHLFAQRRNLLRPGFYRLLRAIDRFNREAVEALAEAGGFVLHQAEDFGPDYARTLREWREAFRLRLTEVRALGFYERFLRKWDYYLCYCEAAFALRNISLVQTLHTRPNNLAL
ncbi:MAG TPA: FAD-dependent oxidoreductase [Opitutaceae bacterium]|nr:FAD-dependent oxidoreductase [Opitutaceae bacterium]